MLTDSNVGHVVLMLQVSNGQLLQKVGRISYLLALALGLFDAAAKRINQAAYQSEKALEDEHHQEDENTDEVDNCVELFQPTLFSAEDPVEPIGHGSSVLLQNGNFNLFVILEIEDFRITDHVESCN